MTIFKFDDILDVLGVFIMKHKKYLRIGIYIKHFFEKLKNNK